MMVHTWREGILALLWSSEWCLNIVAVRGVTICMTDFIFPVYFQAPNGITAKAQGSNLRLEDVESSCRVLVMPLYLSSGSLQIYTGRSMMKCSTFAAVSTLWVANHLYQAFTKITMNTFMALLFWIV